MFCDLQQLIQFTSGYIVRLGLLSQRIRLLYDLKSLEDWERKWLLEFNSDKCKVLHIDLNDNEHLDYEHLEVYLKSNQVLTAVHDYMIKNQLHINMTKSVYMHFRPGRYSSCARAREFGNEKHLKITDHTLMKVEKVKFLGVIIDEELSWEYQVDHLREKLNSSINIIKRIMKFIPKSEYHKLYDSLFKSHLSYCISSWGGISSNKLSPIFLLQKRCVRLLFGKVPMFDHTSCTMRHVPDPEHTLSTWPRKIISLKTLNQSLIQKKY